MNRRTDKPTREEQISQVADILFCNTETGQLSIEKCYELAEKIVTERGTNSREDETVTNCNQLEDEIDSEWAKCKPIDEGMGLESATIVNEQFYDIARHFANWGAEHLKKEDYGYLVFRWMGVSRCRISRRSILCLYGNPHNMVRPR